MSQPAAGQVGGGVAAGDAASCLYEGTLRHRRFEPVEHQLELPLYMVYFDLSELPEALDGHPLWSARGPALAWFRRADYLSPGNRPLETVVRDLVERRAGWRPRGPIRLLTQVRTFGYCFNPVSFYYCFGPAEAGLDSELQAIVADVHNTPWGERHAYVLDGRSPTQGGRVLDSAESAALRVPGSESTGGGLHRFRFAKQFHVSPFLPMEQTYDWRFRVPGRRLVVHMHNEQRREGPDGAPGRDLERPVNEGPKVFDATLTLTRRPLTRRNLTRVLLRYPAMSGRVLLSIYWNALRLWLRGAPFHEHPNHSRSTP